MITFDMGALDKWAENMANVLESERSAFLLDCARMLGGKFVEEVQQRTKDGDYDNEYVEFTTRDGKKVKFKNYLYGKEGGELRRAWDLKEVAPAARGANTIVHNPIDYAPYVEYGHVIRTKKGGPIKGFVPGKNMMRDTQIEMEERGPELLEEKYSEFLKRVLE